MCVCVCKVQALWALSGTNHKAKLALSLSGWLSRYPNVEYLQSLPEEMRTITVQSLSDFTFNQLVGNLPCMQIFVIWVEASWQLPI